MVFFEKRKIQGENLVFLIIETNKLLCYNYIVIPKGFTYN